MKMQAYINSYQHSDMWAQKLSKKSIIQKAYKVVNFTREKQ